jgi:hypothetical protein
VPDNGLYIHVIEHRPLLEFLRRSGEVGFHRPAVAELCRKRNLLRVDASEP